METGVFLVEVFCVGAKLAVYETGDGQDYQRCIRDHYLSRFPMVPAEPACARKLVEQAVRYAQTLGFGPGPDYERATRVFRGLHAGYCPQEFAFGHQGKPLYRRGPRESEAQAPRLHGPYYQFNYVYRGIKTSEFIRKANLHQVRTELANYKTFRRLTEQWIGLAFRLAQAQEKLTA